MKPSFALNFTDDSIGLLHRTSRGWLEVGSVPIDEPDLGAAIAYLRGSALGLEPRGITTKLVLPNSQIRYLTLKAPGPDAASRRAQIKTELEGRTPYAVEDLVFDWWGKGPTVQVAIVARSTLEEAEVFAKDNRLNPVSFVAIPEPGDFGAEPWFGPTAMAASLLAAGEKVDRDQDPIQIVGRAARPEPLSESSAAEDPAPEAEIAAPVPSALGGIPDEAGPSVGADTPRAIATVAPDVLPEISLTEEPSAMAVDQGSLVKEAEPEDQHEAMRPSEPIEPDAAKPAAPIETGNLAKSAVVETKTPAAIPPLRAIPADAMTRKPAPVPRIATKPGARPPEAPKRPAASGPARLSPVTGGGGRAAAKMAVPAPDAEWPLERVTNAARVAQAKGEAARAPVVTAPSIPMQRERRLSVVPPPTEGAAAPASSVAEPTTVFGTPPVQRRGKPRFLGLILTLVLLAVLAAVGLWSSIFLASGESSDTPAVALAATDGEDLPDIAASQTEPAAETAALQAPTAAETGLADAEPVDPSQIEAGVNEPAADDEMIADGQDPEAFATEAFDPATGSGATGQAEVVPDETNTAAEASSSDTETAVAEPATVEQPDTGSADARTPSDDPQDEIFLAMVDPTVATSDAVALAPPTAATDALPPAQPEPPPFGTLYRFDAAGLIIPTPEGIITPEGVRLVAGRPPIVPPERPAALAEAPAAAATEAEASSAAAQPAAAEPVQVQPDPALASFRPKLRPAELTVPATTANDDDDAALRVTDAPRFASLKPRARPPEVLASGEAQLAAADEAISAATNAAVQAAAASLVAGDGPANSQLAIAVSRKPAPRPKDFGGAIDAAVSLAAADATLSIANAAKAPEPKPAVPEPQPEVKLAKLSPETPTAFEVDEPEVTSAAPSIPTRASVAKQATFKGAINLSKTNLIGVYGTSASRYALVRQGNGRFVKVEVGDRLDGGSVAAISERELLYVKNGQSVTLKMPKG